MALLIFSFEPARILISYPLIALAVSMAMTSVGSAMAMVRTFPFLDKGIRE